MGFGDAPAAPTKIRQLPNPSKPLWLPGHRHSIQKPQSSATADNT
jgi:hypothetical protein